MIIPLTRCSSDEDEEVTWSGDVISCRARKIATTEMLLVVVVLIISAEDNNIIKHTCTCFTRLSERQVRVDYVTSCLTKLLLRITRLSNRILTVSRSDCNREPE